MILIPLQNLAYQTFTIRLGDSIYDIALKETNGVMAIDIIRDNIIVIQGSRLVSGFPIIPYPYLQDGNFMLITNNGDYPYYTQFNITQFLIFASMEELEVIINGS